MTTSQTKTSARNVFAHNLRALRERAGLSQEALAKACGLHRTELSLLERRLRSPRLDTMIILARGLKLDSLTELVRGIGLDQAAFKYSYAPDIAAFRSAEIRGDVRARTSL